jgi:hypothetical protein
MEREGVGALLLQDEMDLARRPANLLYRRPGQQRAVACEDEAKRSARQANRLLAPPNPALQRAWQSAAKRHVYPF